MPSLSAFFSDGPPVPWRQDFPFGPEYSGSRVPKRRIEKAKEGRKAVALAPLRMPCSLALQSCPNCPKFSRCPGGVLFFFFFCREKAFFSFFFFSQSFTSHNPLLFPFSLSLAFLFLSHFSIIKLLYVTLETPCLSCCCHCLSLLARTFQFVTSPSLPPYRAFTAFGYYFPTTTSIDTTYDLEFPQIGYPDRFLF